MRFKIWLVVCLSLALFTPSYAQDISDLSEEQKELIKSYRGNKSAQPDTYYYESQAGNQPSTNSASKPIVARRSPEASELTPFKNLLPFGMNLFESTGLGEVPIGIASASDYIIGPGDNITIYLWGRVDKEIKLTFDREGKVFVPQVGEIIGWGLSVEEFTKLAKKKFRKVYTDFELTVSLGKIRSLQIYVTGEVNRPGAYSVSSLTSILNALFLAGGPNGNGTLRAIQLKRNGKLIVEMDLYELLLEGNSSTNIKLHAGDVIFVPTAGPQIAIRGEIKRPAIYEIKGDERVQDLLRLAGSPTPEAYLERLMLERVVDNDRWQVIDLNLKDQDKQLESNIALYDGDKITVYSIFQAKKNIVAIFGHVKHRGYYERTDSIRVSDIVSQAQLRPYDVHFERADLFRRFPDFRVEIIPIDLTRALNKEAEYDFLLQDLDSLHIYSIQNVERKQYVFIEGQVRNPGTYPLYDSMTVGDLIFLAGSYTRQATLLRGTIARLDDQAEITLIDLDLTQDSAESIRLIEDDRIYIRAIPEWQLNPSVTMAGEIRFPGNYTLSSRNETLWQLLQRAGGFTARAFPEGLILKRPSIRADLDRVNISELIDKSVPVIVDSLGNVKKEEQFDFNLSSMDRIVIDMDKFMSSEGAEGDVTLRPGDNIFVPLTPSGISVMGAVGANGTINYKPDQNVRYYLESAGGFTKSANKGQTRLVLASGRVISGGGIQGKRVELGGIIVVPTKIRREGNTLKKISEAFGVLAGALTTVYVISKI